MRAVTYAAAASLVRQLMFVDKFRDEAACCATRRNRVSARRRPDGACCRSPSRASRRPRTSIGWRSASTSVPPIRWSRPSATAFRSSSTMPKDARCCLRWCAIGPTARPRSATKRRSTSRSIRATRSFRSSASWGAHARMCCTSRSMPYDFVERADDAPGMLQLRTAAGVKSPVEVSAEILKVAARARGAVARRRSGRRGRHRSRPTSTTRSGRRPRTRHGWPASTCCACSTNRPPPPSPMGWITAPKAPTRSTTSVAERSIFRFCKLSQGRVRGARHRRRLGAGRRRLRPSAVLLDHRAGAGCCRCPRTTRAR